MVRRTLVSVRINGNSWVNIPVALSSTSCFGGALLFLEPFLLGCYFQACIISLYESVHLKYVQSRKATQQNDL